MDNRFIRATAVTIFLAVVGYFVTYSHDVSMMNRKEKLDRVNRQLKDLYGPLYSLTSANDTVWRIFKQNFRTGKPFAIDSTITDDEKKVWVSWMSTVFMPINEKMYNVIINNTDLIIEDGFPEPLKEFCAHEETYLPVVAKWNKEDYSELTSSLNYPNSVNSYVKRSYFKLKEQQAKLLK